MKSYLSDSDCSLHLKILSHLPLGYERSSRLPAAGERSALATEVHRWRFNLSNNLLFIHYTRICQIRAKI